MNDQLRKLRQRLKREEQIGKDSSTETGSVDTLDESDLETAGGNTESEREEVLSVGQRFVRPLTMNPQRALKITGLIVAGLLIAILVTFAVWIYRYQGESDAVYRASRIIPYPAACVGGSAQVFPYPSLCAGGEFIGYDDYLFELRTLKQYAQNPIGGNESVDFDSEEGKKQLENFRVSALSKAQNKVMIQQVAEERGVEVPDAHVQERLDELIQKQGGREQFRESVNKFYGWSMSDFESVLRSQLLQQQLVRKRAQEVLQRARSGETDFATLVKQHSVDSSSRSEGGDVGYINKGSQFPSEFEETALNLEKGEISGLVPTSQRVGFHILKATDKDQEKGTRISHILVGSSELRQEVSRRLQEGSRESYIGVPMERQSTPRGPGSGPQRNSEGGT